MSINKNDGAAVETWGAAAYESIPKSVFALVAFHLADRCSGECGQPGAAKAELVKEIMALTDSGILDAAQVKRVLKAFA